MGIQEAFMAKEPCRRFLQIILLFGGVMVFFITMTSSPVVAEPAEDVGSQERCPVCGMFVAKYPVWVTQIRMQGGEVKFFDGVKDLMVYYRNPDKFSGHANDMNEVWVKDYYTLEWLDGLRAFYVIGSDVYGPMGHEFIPFSSLKAAENFKKDHKGTKIIFFDEITLPLLDSMRHGQKMRP